MARHFSNWIESYIKYASITEAPKRMHFWSGVSAVAGALRRKVWIDMVRFKWLPSFYIIFVAPPGIAVKSSTADISMDLLREVPGINFGPDVVTWQALVTAFARCSESFQYGEEWWPMSPMTLLSSELGNLINPQDRDMVNLYINLWDGRKKLEKETKMSGSDIVEAPWINMLGCTTPHWIADNMPAAAIGGGFTSRCVFIYTEEKEKFVAYVDELVPHDDDQTRAHLIQDLEYMSLNLVGPYTITKAAREWGKVWYKEFWQKAKERMDDKMIEGYAARKQTHMHKLAMVWSAAQRDSLVIELEDLQLAETMLTDLEQDMPKVFARIGRTDDSLAAEKLITMIQRRGKLPYEEAYRFCHTNFPDFKDFEGIVSGAIRSGQIESKQYGNSLYLEATNVKVP